MGKEDGIRLLKKMEQWAGNKVIVITLNGYLEQNRLEENPDQRQESRWNANDLRNLQFKIRGLNGLKIFRMKKGFIISNPALLMRVLSGLSQVVAYYFPSLAVNLMAIKKTGKNN